MRSICSKPLLIAGVLLAALHSDPAWAQIRLQGPAENIRLEAGDVTVEEILAALRTRFDVHYRGTALNRRVTVTYEGPLRLVLGRVLEGYDYVIKPNGTNIEVIVLSTGSPREAAPVPILRRRAD
jgi:hypothetical protein